MTTDTSPTSGSRAAQASAAGRLDRAPLCRPAVLLTLGVALTVVTDMRGGAGIFAWFAPIPYLLHAAWFTRWPDRAWLFAALLMAFGMMFAKQVSPPFSYSVPFGALVAALTAGKFFLAHTIWSVTRRWAGDLASIAAFPAALVSMEYVQAFYTPFGVWGALANTQVFNLTLLQTASLTGFLGISALIAWGAASMATLLLDGTSRRNVGHIAVFALVAGSLHIYGDTRLDRTAPGQSVRVAAVVSDLAPPTETPQPSDPAVQQATDRMLARTGRAAQKGAAYVVWSEVATFLAPENEAKFRDRLAKLARAHDVAIIATYGVVPPGRADKTDATFANTYVWIRPNGTVAQHYTKHHPVPGEGSVQGTAPLRAVATDDGRMAGAICYDYDFPRMAQRHADLGTGLVALPGLDWRGMRRRHSYMARMRAIEGGFSMVRSVKGGVSLAVDGYGRIRAGSSDFARNDNLMFAELPVERVETVYSRIGNVVAYTAVVVLVGAIGAVFQRYAGHALAHGKRARHARETPSNPPLPATRRVKRRKEGNNS